MPFAPEALIFWLALSLLVYLYVGYPLVAWLRATLHPRSHRREPALPTVTVIVVAYNEEERIRQRIENLLALEYPREKLEIVLASDGSTDGTVKQARRFRRNGVRVRAFDNRRGKSAVLNDVVPSARGEIVVLADARQVFEAGALRALVADFADPTVGAVSGELMMTPNETGEAIGAGASFYWRYEKFIRRSESQANSTVGATGAVYAIRRTLFEPIPEDTILDDVLIPMRIVSRGYRVLLEPEARAYDAASASAKQEFVRKVRTIAGTFQLFAREHWLLSPRVNPVWFETISHKGLRLLTPPLHATVFATNVALASSPLYQAVLAAQVLFYLAAVAGYLHGKRQSIVLLRVPYTMCLLVWATAVGFVYFATRHQQVTWERVAPTEAHSH
jgi:cellulose synthase/poly-beta-1,6-N-acetylglucosamine synthase-like glycosyltransferase